MKRLIPPIIIFSLTLPFVSCSECNCGDIVPDKVAVSKDGRIKLGVSVVDSAITIKLTNVSNEPLVVDAGGIDGGFCYCLALYDHEGNFMPPENVRIDSTFDDENVDFSKALIELSPGESTCKTYRSNEYFHYYQIAQSYGELCISRGVCRMPEVKDASSVTFEYDTTWTLYPLLNRSDQKAPENVFDGSVEVKWDRGHQ